MSGILSQEEIDALLSVYSSGGSAPGKAGEGTRSREVRLYDFAHPEKFSKEQLRQLEAVHNSFASSLSHRLSATMRNTLEVRHTTLDQSSFEEYLKSIPSPTLTSTFKLEPAGVKGVIEVNPNIVFVLVDLLTGGSGEPKITNRPVTPIELKLMEGVLKVALSEYQSAWAQFAEAKCSLERAGSDQMINPIARPQDRMVSVYFEVQTAAQVGLMSLCIPISGVEALLSSLAQRSDLASQALKGERAKIEQHLKGSQVTASVLLGTAGVTLRDILDLAPGDTVRLDQPVDREIRLAVQGVPKFHAVPGVLGRKLAVQLTRTVEQEAGLPDKEAA